jgi:hypothetical protein
MGKPSFKSCPMPFATLFVGLFNPCKKKLYHRLNNLQANLLETNRNFNINTSILACFVESVVKT